MSSPEAAPALTARVRLKRGRDRPVLGRHPWVFSGAVEREWSDGAEALALVESADGVPLGLGFFNPGSRIRVRLLPDRPQRVDRDYFRSRLVAARALRNRMVGGDTDGYRLLNAEGDGLPGWTVDRFGAVLVSQITCAGLEKLRDAAYEALAELEPGAIILHRGDLAQRRDEGMALDDVLVRGAELPSAVWFRERGLLLRAEIDGGQKTGFYCDQRENRARVEALAGGRSLLDLFAHTGAFSLGALRGGATRVVLVESARRLLDLAREQLLVNELDAARAELVEADVFRDLREREQTFDLVVCDPPPLARRRSDLDRAARAYKDLNRLALRRLAPGGLFATFTCSGAVDGRLFRQILFAAATEAGVRLQLLSPLGAALDHPVSLAHPEGEYLKGWLAHRPLDDRS